jgi:hypothetical protein
VTHTVCDEWLQLAALYVTNGCCNIHDQQSLQWRPLSDTKFALVSSPGEESFHTAAAAAAACNYVCRRTLMLSGLPCGVPGPKGGSLHHMQQLLQQPLLRQHRLEQMCLVSSES